MRCPAVARYGRALWWGCLFLLIPFAGFATAAHSSLFRSSATGVLINEAGDVLTVDHALQGCEQPLVEKAGRVYRAERGAVNRVADLAVLHTGIRPLLTARWAGATPSAGTPVYAQSYQYLATASPEAMRLFYNAIVEGPSHKPHQLRLTSPVTRGASGSPVLDSQGQVVGLIQAQQHLALGNAPRRQIVAIDSPAVQQFLAKHAVAFELATRPQLEPLQPKAPRALTLSVGMLCGY